MINKKKEILFFIKITFLCVLQTTAQKKEVTITLNNYKEQIVKSYYVFQKTEKERLLDSILSFVKLNKLDIKEDTINSKILYLRGVNNLFLKRYDKAEEYFLKSFVLAEKTNDILLKGTIYNSRGVVAVGDRKDYRKAEKLYNKAIVNYKKINQLPQQIDSYYNLTINSRNQKKWEESIKNAYECIHLINIDKERTGGLEKLYYYIADSNIELKNYPEAIANLKIVEQKLKPSNNYLSYLLNKSYGKIHESKKEYALAVKRYKKVNEDLKKVNNKASNYIKNSFERELDIENKLNDKRERVIEKLDKSIYLGILIILLLVLLTVVLIWFRKKNKIKEKEILNLNEELKGLISDLRGKNNEIENLLELNEQTLFSRILKITTYNDTIKNISEDIEAALKKETQTSGYLVTLNKKLLSLITEEELWEDFKIQFEKIRPKFFGKLKEKAPSLSVNDLKHCTYIISNLKSKEVAQLINVSPRSVETTRYRVKKKMGLEKEDSLYDFLSNL